MLAILVAGWMAVMLLKAGAGGAVLQGIGSADLGLPDFDYLSSNDPDFYNISVADSYYEIFISHT